MNKKDKRDLIQFQKFMPEGLDWKPERIMQWFRGHCHDLKECPCDKIAKGEGKAVTEYLKEVFIDGADSKKEKKPKAPKAPKAPKEPKPE